MFNQYNPWQMPKAAVKPRVNWGNLLNNTQKTLGIINQAIPIVYQMRPLVNNARTIFKIAGAMNDTSKSGVSRNKTVPPQYDNHFQETASQVPNGNQKDSNTPQFFL